MNDITDSNENSKVLDRALFKMMFSWGNHFDKISASYYMAGALLV